MKIMIATDVEGIGGIYEQNQTHALHTPTDPYYHYYQEARRLLTAEVNAAVQGAKEGGCDEVVVWDGHHRGSNLVVSDLHPDAEYIIGTGYRGWIPLDESYQGMALVGFHAKAGTPNGVLEHTQSYSVHYYAVNGVEMGEIGQAALLAGHFGIPVIFISSDDAGCAEARKLLGEHIVAVSVKTGLAREGARLKAPRKCCELIRAGMKQAVALIGRPETKPFRLEPPYHVVEEDLAPRTHIQSDRELAEGRTRFIARHESTRDTVPFLDIRTPGESGGE
jgi:D-amino peptidase